MGPTSSRAEQERSTLVDGPDLRAQRRSHRIRAVALLGLTAFVVAGLFGCFGVRTGVQEASSTGGLHLRVEHPTVARPALAVPIRFEVSQAGGFDGQIRLTVTTSYLAAFDENGMAPEPDSSTTGPKTTSWTFDPPEGEVLVVWLDTRVEPGVQWRREARVQVEADDQVVAVDISTWIAP